jgi:hypothetical protein
VALGDVASTELAHLLLAGLIPCGFSAKVPERPTAAARSRSLAGHPKLRNDLRRPTMEEIGYRGRPSHCPF